MGQFLAMDFIADLHVHSHFSRATGRELDLEHLWIWAQRKGVTVVGTGDFTHPEWFAELEQKLVPAEAGLYALRPDLARSLEDQVPAACTGTVRFMLTAEISNIYKYDQRTRKVHNLLCVPDLNAAAAMSRTLSRLGNIHSDGRPILGLDSRDLLELLLESSDRGVLIPAHIWTPWFSALGSKSGFDSIEGCYRDLCSHVFALETGLSSDPPMNWRLSALDRFTLVSNSDAHSPAKLAREANIFSCELSYDALFSALRHPTHHGFEGTLEFFPEEGKYHFDGHRKCALRLTPEETRENGGLCPACGKPVTLGVMYRVDELADRPLGYIPEGSPPFHSLISLSEVLGEVLGVGSTSKGVERTLDFLSQRLGPELVVLRTVPEEELQRLGGPLLVEAIRRMRRGQVTIEGGYDGEFGKIHLLSASEREQISGQTALFTLAAASPKGHRPRGVTPSPPAELSLNQTTRKKKVKGDPPKTSSVEPDGLEPIVQDPLHDLDEAQRQAVIHLGSPVIIVAGPGTGKTRTLTARIAHRILQGLDPQAILAVTFTTKAAAEMRSRLLYLLDPARAALVQVFTFHAFALYLVNDWRSEQGLPALQLIGEAERLDLLASILPQAKDRQLAKAALEISLARLRGENSALVERYQQALRDRSVMDLDGLVSNAVELLRQHPTLLQTYRDRFRLVCIDEYQDINQAQYELVRLLCPQEADLCVIGDPDQAIYSFRGADSQYFLTFHNDYPSAVRFTLEQSYRTASALLEAAQRLIQHNTDRIETTIWSKQPGRPHVGVYRAASTAAEAEFIVHSIEQAIGGTTLFSLDSGRADGTVDGGGAELSFADFAILFRVAAQADELCQAFERSGIPYTCSANQNDLEAAVPVLDFLRNVIASPLKIDDQSDQSRAMLMDSVQSLAPALALRRMIADLCPTSEQETVLQYFERLTPLLYGVGNELQAWAPALLALMATTSETDRLAKHKQAVSLLTLHASKGLEFPVVFIAGCEEGLLPHRFPGEEEEASRRAGIEEERRLMYVGMTRAQRILVLTQAAKRKMYGAIRPSTPSRFLQEIPESLLDQILPTSFPRRRKASQLDLF